MTLVRAIGICWKSKGGPIDANGGAGGGLVIDLARDLPVGAGWTSETACTFGDVLPLEGGG